jgi:hypothetical protein
MNPDINTYLTEQPGVYVMEEVYTMSSSFYIMDDNGGFQYMGHTYPGLTAIREYIHRLYRKGK